MYTWGYIKNASLAKLDLTEEEAMNLNLLSKFIYYANEVITRVCSTYKPKHTFYNVKVTEDMLGKPVTMPEDFVSFGDDVNTMDVDIGYGDILYGEECHDDDFIYHGYNQLLFKHTGTFHISYNARWITFDFNFDNNTVLNIPTDILDCIPSYIAHQCYKIDDEYKSSVFRNEYEIMLASIDDTDYKNTKTLKIGGGW